jgi:hypothetical protein
VDLIMRIAETDPALADQLLRLLDEITLAEFEKGKEVRLAA